MISAQLMAGSRDMFESGRRSMPSRQPAVSPAALRPAARPAAIMAAAMGEARSKSPARIMKNIMAAQPASCKMRRIRGRILFLSHERVCSIFVVLLLALKKWNYLCTENPGNAILKCVYSAKIWQE